MKLQILGTGCARCKALARATEQAAQELGIATELEKVTDLERIMSFGVWVTPALAVDGKVRVAGSVPSVAELKDILQPPTNAAQPGKVTRKGSTRIAITLVVAAVAALAFVARSDQSRTAGRSDGVAVAASSATTGTSVGSIPATTGKLPRLVDLGAGKCIPCKLMAPILADLRTSYAGRMEVVFIDVWKDQDAGKPYGITGIPTQIFYDSRGKELFRHDGFLGKADILAKWKELGVNLGP